MEEGKRQYYLRAEPTAEGRALLRRHQEHLAEIYAQLRINPRLTRADDLHWTTIFLGAPERWTRAFRAVGVDIELTADALLELTIGNHAHQLPMIASANIGSYTTRQLPKITAANCGSSSVRQLPMIASANIGSLTPQPTSYDVFFNGGTNAVFVLLLDRAAEAPARAGLTHLRQQLQGRERSGRLPRGFAAKLFRHPHFPLARELRGGKPHSTLARGRVSRARRRDVLRSIRATRLASHDPIPFGSVDLRTVGSPAAVTLHA